MPLHLVGLKSLFAEHSRGGPVREKENGNGTDEKNKGDVNEGFNHSQTVARAVRVGQKPPFMGFDNGVRNRDQ